MKLIDHKELVEKIRQLNPGDTDFEYVRLVDLENIFESIEIETVDEEEIKALTDRAEKAEDQCGSLQNRIDELKDVAEECQEQRNFYKNIIEEIKGLTYRNF